MKNLAENNLPFISIVIPCRNEEKFIAECLESILEQNYPQDKMEVFVIDGQSEDNTKNIIQSYKQKYSFIKLLINPKKNTPAAFNVGIKSSRGDFIIIMGAHAKYKNDYISKCIETTLKYNVENVGGILMTLPQNNNIIAKCIVNCLSSFFGVGKSYFRKGLNRITEVDTVFGGCYKKEVFNKIGLFNEQLIRSQDIEFNLRLKKAGGKILLNPGIISFYYPKSTLKEFFKHSFISGLWIVYVPKITKLPLKIRHYMPLILVLSILGTLMLSFFYLLFFWISIFLIGIYIIIDLFFSVKLSFQEKNIKYLFLMPITFACRHFGHGLGSFWGLFTKPKQKITYR